MSAEPRNVYQDGLSDRVWKTLYQVALFEGDPEILAKKIDAAQKAIGERALALLRGTETKWMRRERSRVWQMHTVSWMI